jgi:uncharacterized protein
MKKLIILLTITFLLPACMIVGQKSDSKDGFVKIYYPNGKISSEGMMRKGEPDGYWKTYFPSGIVKSEGNRKNHLLDSTWVFYTELGDTLQKVNFLMGKRNGFVLEYIHNAKDPIHHETVISKELFLNDKREGKSFYYYENGKLKMTTEYKNNKKDGTGIEYDASGKIITMEHYINGALVERERMNRQDQNGLKQGVWKTFYDNGRIKTEANYRDNILNGAYKEYDENGNVKVFFQYVQGNLQEKADTAELDIEERNLYDTDGKLTFSGYYRKNVPVGIHRNYDKTGKVVNAVLYNDLGVKIGEGIMTQEGKKEGPWKYFYDDGKIKSEGSYANNLETGNWKYLFENGKTEETGGFKNGKYDGMWQWFYENGNIKIEEEYYEGKAEGASAEYDSVGNVITKGTYFDGQKEGDWFYQAGDYSEKGKYVADLKDGKWQAFYNNGKLEYEGNYLQGNPDGEHIYYYDNGKIKELNFYVMGIAEKNWKKFDENGNLLITITYKDNQEFRINGEKIDFAQDDVKLIK